MCIRDRLGGAVDALISLFVSPLIALISLIYTIVVQQVVYTFISPKIMGNSVDIHPALVILALMTGSALGFAVSGFLGSIVGMLAVSYTHLPLHQISLRL